MNEIFNYDFVENELPDKIAQLIIVDPPYYKIKGDFDYRWANFDKYLLDVEKWAKEVYRLLTDNGTVFWYGYRKNIAYTQIILDKYFKSPTDILIWEILNPQGSKTNLNSLRKFINKYDVILMYSKEMEMGYSELFEDMRMYIRKEIQKIGVRKICKYLNITSRAVGHWTGRSQWYPPSQDNVRKLRERYNIFVEYDEKKREYDEKVKRPFNIIEKYKYNILKFSEENRGIYNHPTVKPEKLSELLIRVASRENDTVLVPFVGSGTECASAKKLSRNFIGYEIDKDFYDMAKERINSVEVLPNLFKQESTQLKLF